MFKRLVFALNLASYMLYPHTLNGEMNLPKVGCTMTQYMDKTWNVEVYQTESGIKNVKLIRTNLKSEKEAYRLCKEWRRTLTKYSVPYQALLKKK